MPEFARMQTGKPCSPGGAGLAAMRSRAQQLMRECNATVHGEDERRVTGADWGRPISIGANVRIDGGAFPLPGINVGDDAIIVSRAVVTRDVAADATVAGNPARPIWRCGKAGLRPASAGLGAAQVAPSADMERNA